MQKDTKQGLLLASAIFEKVKNSVFLFSVKVF